MPWFKAPDGAEMVSFDSEQYDVRDDGLFEANDRVAEHLQARGFQRSASPSDIVIYQKAVADAKAAEEAAQVPKRGPGRPSNAEKERQRLAAIEAQESQGTGEPTPEGGTPPEPAKSDADFENL